MKISGVATMHAPAEKVWTALNDPAVLVRTIPGCEQLEATGPDSYRLIMTAGVASVQGTYTGEISLSDRREPTSFLMTATGPAARAPSAPACRCGSPPPPTGTPSSATTLTPSSAA